MPRPVHKAGGERKTPRPLARGFFSRRPRSFDRNLRPRRAQNAETDRGALMLMAARSDRERWNSPPRPGKNAACERTITEM
jgi:hypothetical protein